MSSYQQTIVVGFVGQNPELHHTQNGNAVCGFSVAVTDVWYEGETKREKTTWYKVSAWRKLAETCSQYVAKGMQIMVVGNVEARGYTNNAGEVAASLELTAREVKFLGGGQKQQSDSDSGYDSPDW